MPFTPFHIVAGTSVKSVFPKYFSWSTFALTNVLIDCEALYYYFSTGVLSHKFFHTIIGGTIIAVLCATLGKPICELGLRIWNKTLNMAESGIYFGDLKWFKSDLKINTISSWSGALTGAYSHILFDSIMHRDITPLSPFTNHNNLLRIISIEHLHYVCLGLFAIGVFVYLVRKLLFDSN